MKLIEQEFDIWGECPSSYEGMIERIAAAGRICYRAEPRGTAEEFIEKRLKPDPPHFSVLEHGNIVALRNASDLRYPELMEMYRKLESRWLTVEFKEGYLMAYGNPRAWMEQFKTKRLLDIFEWLDVNLFQILPPESQPRHTKRVTVELITDRNVLAEITRHRNDVAFSVESQRYVDYLAELLFIKPSWYDESIDPVKSCFWWSCFNCEKDYRAFRNNGMPPQHARVVLNGQCATKIVMTAYLPQWDWMFKLRAGGGAYPQMINLMSGVETEFSNRGWV